MFVSLVIYLSTQEIFDKIIGSLVLLVFVFLRRRYLVIKPMVVVSLIPSAWFMILSLFFRPEIRGVLEVFSRVFVISFSTLLLLQIINPLEISWLIYVITGRSSLAMYPSFLWRVSPHILRDLRQILLINRVKETEFWKNFAVSLLVLDEYADFYEESLMIKRENRFWYYYDKKEIIKTLSLVAILVIYLVIRESWLSTITLQLVS